MHQHTSHVNWLDVLNTVANLGIVAGYLAVPFTVLRRLPVTTFVRVAGIVFFATCAATHAAMAFGAEHSWLLIVNHVVQVGAVWCFVIGFARLVNAAAKTRRFRRGGERAAEVPT